MIFMEKVVKVTATDNLKESIKSAVEGLGGFKKFISAGDVVFVKPNCNTTDPFPASSDLEFLKALTDLLYKNGAKLVAIGDSSTITLNTRRVMEQKGLFKLLEMEDPPRICVFEEGKWMVTKIKNSKFKSQVSLPEILTRVDKVIYVPCLKTHKQARFTGALKLSVGFVKPFERISMHLKNLEEKVAEINSVIKCDLVIMDARKCFFNGGPSEGEVREPNFILASKGRVAVDIEGIRIIQGFKGNSLLHLKDPKDLPQIKRALEMGLS
ncbi:hypothetical protein COT49_00655 [candidate division WWE3 bacterium CG08_land_8_20_14_0_20_40_13]|uniref:DUF362 domain-containing protein n=1 Tax=candidate division WWE3 bacterium CG08_land_8_20_14_0_20_40_13 TaxID=1975084 RepID=A0A2H0XEJ6_UNCKA|nr:MAG: hypothetical protein COT49_00655 [candidate division WWE3 bacterium CG08_land_8_20_14_0_20_40_13]